MLLVMSTASYRGLSFPDGSPLAPRRCVAELTAHFHFSPSDMRKRGTSRQPLLGLSSVVTLREPAKYLCPVKVCPSTTFTRAEVRI